ncbi:MAG: hypothetical protein KAR42_16160, partial [candidate division Zixibacteria bacterium]|nr:hypothetical protein [candidate division Zixibacteria bacterium]
MLKRIKGLSKDSDEYCEYLYEVAYKAGFEGESLNGLILSEIDMIDECTIDELRFLVMGYAV